MSERWRQWTPPVDIVDQDDEIIVEDGNASRSYNVKWPVEVVNKIRHGYQCLKCMEPQERPFPERCENPFCKYPMAARQPQDFELEFEGEEQFVGDAERDWQDLERMAASAERRNWKSGKSIAVPGEKRSPGGVVLP